MSIVVIKISDVYSSIFNFLSTKDFATWLIFYPGSWLEIVAACLRYLIPWEYDIFLITIFWKCAIFATIICRRQNFKKVTRAFYIYIGFFEVSAKTKSLKWWFKVFRLIYNDFVQNLLHNTREKNYEIYWTYWLWDCTEQLPSVAVEIILLFCFIYSVNVKT